ncbi:MAG: hypothetical protein U0838_07500 [Chloroflexota bacterium]
MGPDGKPTSTTHSLTVNNDGTLGQWTLEDKLALPAPRGCGRGRRLDGIVVAGGTDGTAPTTTVFKVQQSGTPPSSARGSSSPAPSSSPAWTATAPMSATSST